ncbi:MAG TPA: CRISPR-associated endonuclease Cas3'' [Caulobacteraceae bacterium]|nr:CRISPR-associated endonuclease Cas3'' [Caulobacteraceae bacterium]
MISPHELGTTVVDGTESATTVRRSPGRFFAHSVKNKGPEAWEPLDRHLLDTAKRASKFAASFGYGEFGYAAGLLHDLGKYQAAFQARLHGGVAKVDHAAHGACHARRVYYPLGGLIAHGIAGHHAGLVDGLFDSEGRLAKMVATLDRIVAAAEGDGLAIPARPTPVPLKASMHAGFQIAFLIRMLFSCLVDADYLATEDFYARAEGRGVPLRGPAATLSELATALDGYLSRFKAPVPGSLNGRRAEILTHARSLSNASPGVFTLTVPTGGGKSLTSLAFALDHARHNGLERVVFGIPFTSVIEQTAQVYRQALAPHADAVLEHHSAFDQSVIDGKEARSKLDLAMETWDQPLIVTTAVRLFESLFSNRPSQCRKLHNLARSVIVLDEVQTLPLELLRPCVTALKELAANYGCSIVLCTATQPALLAAPSNGGRPFIDGFENVTELAPDPPKLFETLRRVRVEVIEAPQTDADIAERLAAAPQALCIVNRRFHAQALCQAIGHLPGARHLSTLMCPAHRRAVLADIREDLRRGRPCRVVSTSLVEAGVDVDFPLVLRAEAGLDSILQAAGRCNREGYRDADSSYTLVFRPAGRKRLQSMRVRIETSEDIFRRFRDVTALPAVAAYFDKLFDREGDAAFDSKFILKSCKDRLASWDFPFATIARDFQMIDDYNHPLIIEFDADARHAVRDLRHLPDALTPRKLARRLQSYTVGVPPQARAKLIATGAAERILPKRYDDQFVVLLNHSLYRADTGLTWVDATLIEPERLVID